MPDIVPKIMPVSSRRRPASAALAAAIACLGLLASGCSHSAPPPAAPPGEPIAGFASGGPGAGASGAQARQQAWAQTQEAIMKAQMQKQAK